MKTRLYTRKRALISSVAMLLVAMIALGTAAYAWFVADPTASAAGLKMRTVSGSGLVILSESEKAKSGTFSHNTILDAATVDSEIKTNPNGFQLSPASFNYDDATFGTNIKTIEAKDDDKYDANTAKPLANATKGGWLTNTRATGDVYGENIYCKVTGGAATAEMALTGVDITWNASNASLVKDALRVVVVGVNGAPHTFGIDAVGNSYINSTTTTYGIAMNPAVDGGEATPKKYTQLAANADLGATKTDFISLGNANAAGTAIVRVYVYLDGEDDKCYSRIANAEDLITNLKLNFALKESLPAGA